MDSENISYVYIKNKNEINKNLLNSYSDKLNFIESRINNTSNFNKKILDTVTKLDIINDELTVKLNNSEKKLEKIFDSYKRIMEIIENKN